jgi:hypothetical protein
LEGDSRRREYLRLQRYLAMLWESILCNQVALDMNIAFFDAFKGFCYRMPTKKVWYSHVTDSTHFSALRNSNFPSQDLLHLFSDDVSLLSNVLPRIKKPHG